jgi:hypothetical protein
VHSNRAYAGLGNDFMAEIAEMILVAVCLRLDGCYIGAVLLACDRVKERN